MVLIVLMALWICFWSPVVNFVYLIPNLHNGTWQGTFDNKVFKSRWDAFWPTSFDQSPTLFVTAGKGCVPSSSQDGIKMAEPCWLLLHLCCSAYQQNTGMGNRTWEWKVCMYRLRWSIWWKYGCKKKKGSTLPKFAFVQAINRHSEINKSLKLHSWFPGS